MRTMTTTKELTTVLPAEPEATSSAVAGRIAGDMLHSAGLYGRRASATMFLWLLTARNAPSQPEL